MSEEKDALRRRISNSLWGLFIGDALAMPVHWYYQRKNIERDFGGGITGFESPRHPHPESFMVGMEYKPDVQTAKALGRPYDILHEHRRYYQTTYGDLSIERTDRESGHGNAVPPIEQRYHYHHGLSAGDNTLGAQLVRVLMRSVAEQERYDPEHFLHRFVEHLTTPGSNRDPYTEVYIRRWFEAYSRGSDVFDCADHQRRTWSIGSHGGMIRPLVVSMLLPESGSMSVGVALEHQNLTHRSESVAAALSALIPFLHGLLRHRERRKLLRQLAGSIHPPRITGKELLEAYRGHKGPGNIPREIMWNYHTELRPDPIDVEALIKEENDSTIAPDRFATACYPEHGVPLMIYLLRRYSFDPVKVLTTNATLGGDNVHRGMVLGLLVGAANDQLPASLVQGLSECRAIEAEIDAFLEIILQDAGTQRI